MPKLIQDNDKTYKRDAIFITELAEGLGLGPTLFLQYTKALAWLFFFLTVLNIPTFIFFYTG